MARFIIQIEDLEDGRVMVEQSYSPTDDDKMAPLPPNSYLIGTEVTAFLDKLSQLQRAKREFVVPSTPSGKGN